MTTFYDDFERADGPVGANWVDISGTSTVASGLLWAGQSFKCRVSQSMGTGNVRVTTVYTYWSHPPTECRVFVKADGTLNTGYFADVVLDGSDYKFRLSQQTGLGPNVLTTTTLAGYTATDHTMVVQWENGTLSGTIDGANAISASTSDYPTQEYVGVYELGANTAFRDFGAESLVSATLTVAPDPVWVGGGSVAMTATGTGTAWTPGVPGSSTVTVDHGTIEDQWTEDGTTIHFTLVPAEYVGTLTFTESEYSLTDEVTATLTPPEGGGDGECPFNDEFIIVANRTGLDTPDARILTTDTLLVEQPPGESDITVSDALTDLLTGFYVYHIPGMTLTLGQAIADLWQAVNGTLDLSEAEIGEQSADSLNALITFLIRRWDADEEPWTVTELVAAIKGPDSISNTHLARIVGVDGQMAYASIVDAINVTRGPEMPTLTAILSAIEAINPGGTTDLTAVMALLNFITSDGVVNLNSVLSTLATMRGDNSSTLHAIQAYCVTAIAKLDEIKTYLQDQLGPMTVTLAAIEAKVDAILALLQQLAVTRYQPPVWPGLDHVELLDPSNLATHLTVVGPMDGVNVHISSTDGGTGFYDYDTHRCWRNIGALAFYNDAGFMEAFQPLGWTAGIYVPKTMTRAAGVRFHLGRGPEGWVTPWRVLSG